MARDQLDFFEDHLLGEIVQLTLAGLLSHCGYEVIRYGYENHLFRATKDLSLIDNEYAYRIRSAPDLLVYDIVPDAGGKAVKSSDHFCRLIEAKACASDTEWAARRRGFSSTWVATKNAVERWPDELFAIYSIPLRRFFCFDAKTLSGPQDCVPFSKMQSLSTHARRVTSEAETEFIRRLGVATERLASKPRPGTPPSSATSAQ